MCGVSSVRLVGGKVILLLSYVLWFYCMNVYLACFACFGCISLRGKCFHGVGEHAKKDRETGFSVFSQREKWGESQNQTPQICRCGYVRMFSITHMTGSHASHVLIVRLPRWLKRAYMNNNNETLFETHLVIQKHLPYKLTRAATLPLFEAGIS